MSTEPSADATDPFAGWVAEPESAPSPDPVGSAVDVERVAAERDEYLDALQRLKAEFDNYRRRAERDRVALQRAGVRDIVVDLLPVMDNLERALAAASPDDGLVSGVEMVRGQLAALLSGRGVSEIEAAERPFDPTFHEAIAQVPSEAHAEGTVMAVMEKGYRHDEVVVRPARVVVATSPVASE
ncbi:MAG: nucleotide exchange factor GrpE [Actinobacteria bacterium]|nr:nucleotide exchange factor GrpE [Actinomycetota bacterium]